MKNLYLPHRLFTTKLLERGGIEIPKNPKSFGRVNGVKIIFAEIPPETDKLEETVSIAIFTSYAVLHINVVEEVAEPMEVLKLF